MKCVFKIVSICAIATSVIACSKNNPQPQPQPEPESAKDLSADGTANCYVVSAPGTYKFKATVKGGSIEPVGTPAIASVLWETFGTKEQPSEGDILSGLSLSDGYVTFKTPSQLSDGNAVIAVKDSTEKILWSWHIWVCNGFDPSSSAQVYKNQAGTVMDRNLGATSVTPGDCRSYGLLYQWGRKDPFIGLCSTTVGKDTTAATTIAWPESVFSDETNGTIAYTLENPTTFIKWGSNGDWYYTPNMTTDDTRWQTSDKGKGVYDPCPYGWRVADGSENGLYPKAFGIAIQMENGPWSDENKGMDFGSGNGMTADKQLGTAIQIWYPGAGYYSGTGVLQAAARLGYLWTASPEGRSASCFYFGNEGSIISAGIADRAQAYSIRCVKE